MINDGKLTGLKGVAVVKNGTLHIKQRDKFFEFVEAMQDGYYEIKILPRSEKRGLGQNAYYWSVIIPAYKDGYLDAFGEPISTQTAHEHLKAKFLPDSFSTRFLNKQKFNRYLDMCKGFISMYFSIVVPDKEKEKK